MAATISLIPLRALEPEVAKAFNDALQPIGVQAIGRRGDALVLKIMDRALAEQIPTAEFPDAVRARLNVGDSAQFWPQFTSATYN